MCASEITDISQIFYRDPSGKCKSESWSIDCTPAESLVSLCRRNSVLFPIGVPEKFFFSHRRSVSVSSFSVLLLPFFSSPLFHTDFTAPDDRGGRFLFCARRKGFRFVSFLFGGFRNKKNIEAKLTPPCASGG